MIEAAIFIPLVILAVTQIIKMAVPAVQGWVTIVVAILLGIIVSFIDKDIGVTDISVGTGIMLSLSAIGISVAANKAGGGESGDANPVR